MDWSSFGQALVGDVQTEVIADAPGIIHGLTGTAVAATTPGGLTLAPPVPTWRRVGIPIGLIVLVVVVVLYFVLRK